MLLQSFIRALIRVNFFTISQAACSSSTRDMQLVAAVTTLIRLKKPAWRVERDGVVIAEGLSNSRAWAIADDHDSQARRDEETRRRIDIAMGQW
jgi:hypothetical protein